RERGARAASIHAEPRRRLLREGPPLGRREREPRRGRQHEPPLRERVSRRRRPTPPGTDALSPGSARPGDAVLEEALAPDRPRAGDGERRDPGEGIDRAGRGGRGPGRGGPEEEAGQGQEGRGRRARSQGEVREEEQEDRREGGEGLAPSIHG